MSPQPYVIRHLSALEPLRRSTQRAPLWFVIVYHLRQAKRWLLAPISR